MRLVCPDCGEPIAANNINVNDMIAVCGACHMIFDFNMPGEKNKSRKVKRPEQLEVQEDGVLKMRYIRVFGKDDRGAVFGASFMALMFTMVFLVTLGGFLAGDVPIFVPLIMAIIALAPYYLLSLLLLNQTHIIADTHQLKVHRQPIPNPFEDDIKIDYVEITKIYTEETTASRETGGFNRYYHIWAELVDGTRMGIVKDLPEPYAKYIAQCLEEKMHERTEFAISNIQAELFTENEVFEAPNHETKFDSLET